MSSVELYEYYSGTKKKENPEHKADFLLPL